MIDIEELSNILRQSQPFKKLIIEQVKQCFEDRQNKGKIQEITPLPELTKQIASQLLEITELVLEEQNSHNYMTLMKNNQEFCLAIQRKIELQYEEKIDALNKRIDQLSLQLQQSKQNIKKSTSSSHSQRLKQQRKIITKSILDNSRLVPNSKTKSSINPGQMKQLRFECNQQQQKNKEMLETNDSRSNPSFEDYTYQDQQSVEYRSLLGALKKTVQEVNNQQKKIEQSFRQLSEKLQFKLQSNLEGLWNVLGDLNARLAKFQSGEALRMYGD